MGPLLLMQGCLITWVIIGRLFLWGWELTWSQGEVAALRGRRAAGEAAALD